MLSHEIVIHSLVSLETTTVSYLVVGGGCRMKITLYGGGVSYEDHIIGGGGVV